MIHSRRAERPGRRALDGVRELPSEPLFVRPDLKEIGWSASATTRAARSGRISAVRQGVFSAAPTGDPALLAIAAAMACEGSVISHRSAALIDDIALLHQPPLRPDLTVPPYGTGDVLGALLHRATLPPEDVRDRDGFRITAPARTVVDVARSVSVGAGVVTMDSALNQKLATAEEIEEVLVRCARWPGIRNARDAFKLTDANADSALETVSRLVIARLRLPAPKTQAIILDQYGRAIGECDFYWPEFGVFGEADGREKYLRPEREPGWNPLYREKLRQEDLEDVGLTGLRWGWTDVRYRQSDLRRRILNAFDRGQRRDALGLPRAWSVAYRDQQR